MTRCRTIRIRRVFSSILPTSGYITNTEVALHVNTMNINPRLCVNSAVYHVAINVVLLRDQPHR